MIPWSPRFLSILHVHVNFSEIEILLVLKQSAAMNGLLSGKTSRSTTIYGRKKNCSSNSSAAARLMREVMSDKPSTQSMDGGPSRSDLTDSENSSPESAEDDMYSRMYTFESFGPGEPLRGSSRYNSSVNCRQLSQTPVGHSKHSAPHHISFSPNCRPTREQSQSHENSTPISDGMSSTQNQLDINRQTPQPLPLRGSSTPRSGSFLPEAQFGSFQSAAQTQRLDLSTPNVETDMKSLLKQQQAMLMEILKEQEELTSSYNVLHTHMDSIESKVTNLAKSSFDANSTASSSSQNCKAKRTVTKRLSVSFVQIRFNVVHT